MWKVIVKNKDKTIRSTYLFDNQKEAESFYKEFLFADKEEDLEVIIEQVDNTEVIEKELTRQEKKRLYVLELEMLRASMLINKLAQITKNHEKRLKDLEKLDN